MITLINNTKSVSRVGALVSISSSNPNAFEYTIPNSSRAIGCVTEAVPYRQKCKIATIGDTAKVLVQGNTLKDDILRGAKSNDNVSLGTCKIAKSADNPYLKVGVALESGNGLISTVLELVFSGDDSGIGYVPYTGALQNVDLGTHSITATGGRFGTSVNYTDINSNGHQTMAGDARPWRDELGDALGLQSNGAGVSINLAESTVDLVYNATYNVNPALADFLYKNVQLNHDRDLTASIYPHIHWFQAKNYTPNLLLEYRWQKNGSAKTTAWTKLKCTDLIFPYTSGTIHQISDAAAIAVPVGTTLSDIVQFRIYRDTTNASTEFAGACPYNTGGNASVPVLSFDVHLMINSVGSDSEYIK